MPITFKNFGDCTSSVLGTGKGKCDLSSFGDPRGVSLLQKNWSLDVAADSFDQTTYKNAVKSLTAFPLLELYNFDQGTPENERATSSTGVLTDVRSGKPQFTFMYDKGGCFHKALYDKRGKNRWDLAIIFDTGVLMAANAAGTKVSGFNMGMLSVDTFKLIQGSDPQMSSALMQLLDAYEFNFLHEFFTWEQLGFNMNDIEGVIETTLSYGAAPSASNTVEVKVVGGCNSDEIIAGLDDAAKWRLGGTQASATTINAVGFNATTGVYTLTLDQALANGDSVQPELYDGVGGFQVVEDALGAMYKGLSASASIS